MTSLVDYVGLILTPTADPAAGDIVIRGLSGGWTTLPIGSAPAGSALIIGPAGYPTWGNSMLSALPTPSSVNEGAIGVVSGGASERDLPYLCVKVPGGSFEWDRIPLIVKFTIGDGAASSFTLAHYLNTQRPLVTVINNTTNQAEYPDLTFPDIQRVTVNFNATIPTLNSYTVVVMG